MSLTRITSNVLLDRSVTSSKLATSLSAVSLSSVSLSASTFNVSGSSQIVGNLGVGATPSTYKLEVNGSVGIAGATTLLGTLNVAGQVTTSLGTSAAPSYSFTGDTDTGMYSSGANTLSFATNGVNRVFIDTTGSVGIGTQTPNEKLTISGNISATGTATVNGLQSGSGSGEVDIVSTSGSLLGFRSVETTVATTSGASVSAVALIPAGSFVFGVAARVITAVTGATSFNIGDGTDGDCWGSTIALALSATTTSANFNITAPAFYPTATNVVLTANGANFTGGVVRLACHYLTISGPSL